MALFDFGKKDPAVIARYNSILAVKLKKDLQNVLTRYGNTFDKMDSGKKFELLAEIKQKLDKSRLFDVETSGRAVPVREIYKKVYALLFRPQGSSPLSYFDMLEKAKNHATISYNEIHAQEKFLLRELSNEFKDLKSMMDPADQESQHWFSLLDWTGRTNIMVTGLIGLVTITLMYIMYSGAISTEKRLMADSKHFLDSVKTSQNTFTGTASINARTMNGFLTIATNISHKESKADNNSGAMTTFHGKNGVDFDTIADRSDVTIGKYSVIVIHDSGKKGIASSTDSTQMFLHAKESSIHQIINMSGGIAPSYAIFYSFTDPGKPGFTKMSLAKLKSDYPYITIWDAPDTAEEIYIRTMTDGELQDALTYISIRPFKRA